MSTQENQNPETPDATGTPGTGAPPAQGDAATAGATGAPPKKRGRKSNAERARLLEEQIKSGNSSAGSSSGASSQKKSSRGKTSFTQEQVSTLANQIVGVHMIISKVTGLPEMIIAPNEGEALAKSVTMVMEEYGFEISGKTGAAIQLFATAAMVYAPRIFAINARAKRDKPLDVTVHESNPAADTAG